MSAEQHQPDESIAIDVTVNGVRYRRSVPSRLLLADFLRDELSLTGTHLGCEHGICGACTVICDGGAVRSCLMLAAQADGCAVTTVEGLAVGDELAPLQQCFADNFALQCGFCTAGFLMTTTAEATPKMDEDEVRHLLSGNICRCTGYQHIVKSIQHAAKAMSAQAAD